MALDTQDNRASALLVTLPWRGLLPQPDGALDQGDRQQVDTMYRGILAEEPVVTEAPRRRLLTMRVGR